MTVTKLLGHAPRRWEDFARERRPRGRRNRPGSSVAGRRVLKALRFLLAFRNRSSGGARTLRLPPVAGF